jgi:hypothetical protein
MIIGIIGPEGAGKTCLMTYFGLLHMARGGEILTFPGYQITDGNNKVLSKPLEMDEWVTLPPNLRDVLIDIDEIQDFFGSDRFMSWINKLFASLVGQRRHRSLGIHYTAQDWGEVDPRIRRKTHLLVTCWDLYWSSWGKEQEVKRGELISANFFDVKGFFTGKPWTPGPQFLLNAKPIWNHFDTYADVDIWSGMAKIEIKKPRITIDLTESKEESEGEVVQGKTQSKVSIEEKDMTLLSKLANTPGANLTVLGQLARRLRSK